MHNCRSDPIPFSKTANYVASNWASVAGLEGLPQLLDYGLATQIHELGHSLMARFLGQSDYRTNLGKTGKDGWQREIGWQFEKCVYDNLTGVPQ